MDALERWQQGAKSCFWVYDYTERARRNAKGMNMAHHRKPQRCNTHAGRRGRRCCSRRLCAGSAGGR
jgi:hypothetical protein